MIAGVDCLNWSGSSCQSSTFLSALSARQWVFADCPCRSTAPPARSRSGFHSSAIGGGYAPFVFGHLGIRLGDFGPLDPGQSSAPCRCSVSLFHLPVAPFELTAAGSCPAILSAIKASGREQQRSSALKRPFSPGPARNPRCCTGSAQAARVTQAGLRPALAS